MSGIILSNFDEAVSSMDLSVPTLNLQSYKKINKNTYKIVCSHEDMPYNDEAYRAGVIETFENKMEYVDRTVALMAKDYVPVVSMIVQATSESREFDQKFIKAKRMKEISANVFMDADDNLWKVVESGGQKHIVQVQDDNYDEILSSRLSQRVVTASTDCRVPFYNGDYLMYYHPKRQEIRAGFGLHIVGNNPKPTDIVFDRAAGKAIELPSPYLVIEAFDSQDFAEAFRPDIDEFEVNATLTNEMAGTHIDYMRKLYSGTTYFDTLEQLIAKRKATGDLSMTTMKLP